VATLNFLKNRCWVYVGLPVALVVVDERAIADRAGPGWVGLGHLGCKASTPGRRSTPTPRSDSLLCPEASAAAMPALPAFPLTRRPSDARRRGRLVLSLVVLVAVSAAAALAYLSFPSAGRTSPPAAFSAVRAEADCCRGMEGLELWGPAVKWGSDHRLPSAAACCAACKAMCPHPEDGACRCDSWVFCGDERKCKDRFGEVSPVRFYPFSHLPSTSRSQVFAFPISIDLFLFLVLQGALFFNIINLI